MSSVKIVKCAFTKSNLTIQGNVTLEGTFSETERRLDLTFIPTLYIKASVKSTENIMVAGSGGWAFAVPLAGQRLELAFPQPPIRPSGNSMITVTASLYTPIDPLFKPGAQGQDVMQKWAESAIAGLDTRVDVSC